jgi:hypothetical protein
MEPADPIEMQGVALAALLLSVNTLKLFRQKGTFQQSELNQLVSGVLLALEKNEFVSDAVAHVARSVLSGIATDLGAPQKPTN